MNKNDVFEAGLDVRQDVLGKDYVDRSRQNAGEFGEDMQDLVTRYCWGEIWTRPGLDRKERSLINLAMLSALNRSHEFKLHVRGALTNGVSRAQIREVLLQVAIYCGVPAGVESVRLANEVFDAIDGK
jgi:4-carboxymuconolactone decarboxylase